MRALGWEIGDECYSTVSYTGNDGKSIMPGSKGRVIGPADDGNMENLSIRFDSGLIINTNPKTEIVDTIFALTEGWHSAIKQKEFDIRYKMFRASANQSLYQHIHPKSRWPESISVRRDHLVEDCLKYFNVEQPVCSKITIKFVGESGIDCGGLSREFYPAALEALIAPEAGLFQQSAVSANSMLISGHN